MNILKGFLIILTLFSFTSCVEDSPLSDVDVDDPSFIRPVIALDKEYTASSSSKIITVWLFDKNDNSVQLKSGDVTINDVKLTLKKAVNDAPFYVNERWDVLDFNLNTPYTANIILSDGKSYQSKITTRSKDLHRFTIPSEHPKSSDLTLSWADNVSDDNMTLKMIMYLRNDSTSRTESVTFPLSGSSNGYTVSKSYFSNPEIYKADVTLKSVKTGTVNTSFRNGSTISSTISHNRTVNFK